MIAASGKNLKKSVAQKITQTDWDLSSSITGTVKRRPSSLESCKSNSPNDIKDNIDFPSEHKKNENAKDIVGSSCNIDKLDDESYENNDLSQEIERGNKKKRKEEKIDSPSIKRRILKLPESARKSFTSKLKLPHSLTLSSRNKLSLSQLEQKNNLFIRDGQQQQQKQEKGSENGKINKAVEGEMAKNTNLISSVRSNNKNNSIAVVMDHQNAEGNNSSKMSKKSLIPSFLSTKTNSNTNHIKIPSTSKAHSNIIAEKLTKTGNKFKELCAQKDNQNHTKKPPPYRPPPPIPTTNQNKHGSNSKKIRLSENVDRNYEEIDENCGNNDNISTTINTQAIIHAECGEQSNDTEINSMLAKAEYPSNMFKNIPVRPRKGQISHMENYCLFDPSVDFCNEKDLMKMTKIPIEIKPKTESPRHKPTLNIDVNEEKIEDVIFEDQTLYDITEHDERKSDENSLAHHNYYEIDPELLEKEEEINVKSLAEELEESRRLEQNRKSKIYSNSLSTSSESTTSTSNSAGNSSSTHTSSSDYPSLFNSVIETTHSSTVESTDENDSNGYGKVKCTATADSNESIITVQNAVVTCGDSNGTLQGSTGATKKKSPQLNRIIRPTSRNSSNNNNNISAKQQLTSTKTTKSISTKKSHFDPLKQSHSLPHLQNVSVQNKGRQPGNNGNKNELNFVIDNTTSTTIQMRRSHNSRQVRPLSTHSDDRDSGFLSPATPPDCQNIHNNVIVRHTGQIEDGRTKTESTLLNQCDNIQQMIEIYTQWANYYLERAKSKRKVVDLSTDCRDGLLLAEVIEAVTNFKVPDLIKKPKTQQQMYDNVEACLAVLRQNQVGGLETITTNDICAGRLKAVLSLFFSLSRYKQASKLRTPTKGPQQLIHQAQIHHQSVQSLNSSQGDMTKERQLPVPTKLNGNGTSIPLPATVLVARRSTEKGRGIPVPNGQQSMIRYPSGTPSSENSRPSSPPDLKSSDKLRFQQNSKIPPSPYNIAHDASNVSENAQSTIQQSNGTVKQSMLDKLKLFNKDKERSKSSKRTSSSSGFSSARSDSSLSLNNDPNATSTTKNKKNDALNKVTSSSSSSTVSTQKSSKLLASTKGIKETPGLPSAIKMQSKNENKKEKSMGRNISDENITKLQKVPTVKFVPQIQQINQNDLRIKQPLQPQQQQQPVLRKIEIRTDMKTGLTQSQLMQHQQHPKAIIQPTPVTTSIPKPMAAIKGTSKMIHNDIKRDDVNFDGMKIDKQHIQHLNNSSMSLNSEHHKMQVVNPLTMSPLHNQLLIHAKTNGSSQSMSDSIHSASTNNHSNSSESSVIYRPSASESGGSEFYHSNMPSMQQHRNPIPNRKVDHFNDPLLTVATTNGHKFNTIPSKMNGTAIGIGNNHMTTTIYENGKQQGSSVVPLRSIMRNYNNNNNNHHVTLPTRGARGGQNLVNGYYDEHNQGYCSDGDALRKTQIRYTDIENGYLSEGGGGGSNGVSNPHLMSIFRNRPQLPMTIAEERCRTSKDGNLESPEMDVNAENWNQRQKQSIAMKNANNPKSRVKSVPQNFGYTKKSNGSATAMEVSTNGMASRTAAVSAVPRTNKLGKVSGGTQTTTNDFQQKAMQYKSYSLNGPGAAQLSQSVKDRFASGTNSLPKSGLDMHAFHARSTKSEKTYPSMLSRAIMPSASNEIETEPYYCLPVNGNVPWSQPTSPTPRNLTGLISPTQTNSHRLVYHNKKNDEVHGSQISLMSGGSSMYGSTTEEQRQANEVRRLKRELTEAREQVMSLSSQLSTNAHVVNAFEKSLATMTNRLQSLTAATEKKESEITEMRQTIELLKKQSIQAGLTSAHIESMGVQMNVNGNGSPTKKSINGSHESGLQNGNGTMQRQLSTDSVCSINSLSSNCSTQDKKKKKGWLRSSFTKAFSRNAKISKTNRQMSLNGNLSESKASLPPPTPQKTIPKLPTANTVPDLGKPPISPTKLSNRQVTLIENAKPFDSIEVENHPIVEELKKQLREKDMVLTDIRLEALTQASQMETLKETVKAMRQEMMSLRHNNDRLQKMVTSRSLAGSETSIGCPASPCSAGDSRRYSFATDSGHSRPPLDLPDNLDETEEEDEVPTPAPAPLSPHLMHDISPTLERISLSNDILATPGEEAPDSGDGKRISIAVYLGQAERYSKYMEELSECEHFNDVEDGLQHNGNNLKYYNHFNHSIDDPKNCEMIIACTYISGKTTWQNLDYIVRKTFKDYLSRVDPGTNLGLNTDSITSYHLGEAKRGPEMGFPELLPCGYIIGNVKSLYICLQGVGSLAFDTLIPRSIVHRYINLLTEHRRLILCGPKGTGKSHLARKLAEFLVAKSNRSPAESIATFNVDHKSSKDLQHYLSQIAEQASINCSMEELPAVIILDNLHHASELGDVFSCLLSAGPATKLPCIIGTMSQATCNTTNLQLHHNFRWVLTANHMEPVKGFLGRFLRRRLYDIELLNGSPQVQMEKIFRWLPTLVQHINSFLETHSSSDVTIGPQLFLECPIDVNDSQKWFLDLWNNTLAPYMINAIKEGVQLYGRRGNAWTDPCLYIRETYPWPITPSTVPKLKTITAQDVGLEEAELLGNKEDPLLNMLNQLKEAASWNEIQQDDSDCVSLDSNFTHDSSVAEN
ncbi:protein sickie-like isoform X5 [Chironomus tepperi]|uniref:protein sickie-like isoform X5 n=1 Tax=Chironomus tepperi TaxID=113505 RepID=UPI00391F1968